MGFIVAAWALVLGMSAWAIYLFFAWSGAPALPMQWGVTGKPTWFAARGPAVAAIPLLAFFTVGMLTFAVKGPAQGASAFLTSVLLLAIQALWVFLARRYV
jgi:hypothetical protein